MTDIRRFTTNSLQINQNGNTNDDENFCVSNVLCVFVSFIIILADLTTDILVLAEYCKGGYGNWALSTLLFILIPNVIVNIFSIRWLVFDKHSDIRTWMLHGCLLGFFERYVKYLYNAFTCKNFESYKNEKLACQRNDSCLLHFLYIFTGTVPQIVLQSYVVLTLNENYSTKVLSLIAATASVVWGCASYIQRISDYSHTKFRWTALALMLAWHFGILIGRISGILLFSLMFGIWTLIPLGVHWSIMTLWIVVQKTTFCPNKIEETLYNVVMGFVYCFCFINLREGSTRYRLIIFYIFMTTQNFSSFVTFLIMTEYNRNKMLCFIMSGSCIFIGTIAGVSAMLIYYRYFHYKGPITWKQEIENVELNNKVISQTSNESKGSNLNYARSFKSLQKSENSESISSGRKLTNTMTINENADKKFLVDHLIARSSSPNNAAQSTANSSIEIFTVENTPISMVLTGTLQRSNSQNNTFTKGKTICSPTELNLKLAGIDNMERSIDEITSGHLNSQKRRGICSSDELCENLTNINISSINVAEDYIMKVIKADLNSNFSNLSDSSHKKSSSDSLDMDLDLSFSDINSTDINNFNENIVQKLCLSALKNIKVGNQQADIENIQRIAIDILKEMHLKKGKSKKEKNSSESSTLKQRDLDTPTEMLSVHDYENICAVNIAREAWGLRSWNGYSDIENYVHDGSVVRDKIHDTFTSGSSEISSCVSQDLKNAILAAPSFPKKSHTYSNVFVKFDKSSQQEYDSPVLCQSNDEMYLAKPCIIDAIKDPNYLEPILEELDDLADIDRYNKKRLCSESSLVATIDEIRKATVTSSPRNLYHRREFMWDSPQQTSTAKIECNLKKALWKEPSQFDSSNIMESLPEKENIVINISHESKFDSCVKDTILAASSSTHLDSDTPNITELLKKQKNKHSHLKPGIANEHNLHLQDLSNRDIDLLWKLVSENDKNDVEPNEGLVPNRSLSLQSLIQESNSSSTVLSNPPTSKQSNLKKTKCKPRRKFSILREKFEPRMHSDEEVLYECTEPVNNPTNSNVVNVKNYLRSNI